MRAPRLLPVEQTADLHRAVEALVLLAARVLGASAANHLVRNALGGIVDLDEDTAAPSLLDALRAGLVLNRDRARDPRSSEPEFYAPFLDARCDVLVEEVAAAWEAGCDCCAARATWRLDLGPDGRDPQWCDAHLPPHLDLAAEEV